LLKELARKELREGGGVKTEDVEHVIMWMGDIVIVYIQKVAGGKDASNLEVNFPELTNLKCLTHKINKGFSSLKPFGKDMLVVFEKIDLTAETKVDHYSISPF